MKAKNLFLLIVSFSVSHSVISAADAQISNECRSAIVDFLNDETPGYTVFTPLPEGMDSRYEQNTDDDLDASQLQFQKSLGEKLSMGASARQAFESLKSKYTYSQDHLPNGIEGYNLSSDVFSKNDEYGVTVSNGHLVKVFTDENQNIRAIEFGKYQQDMWNGKSFHNKTLYFSGAGLSCRPQKIVERDHKRASLDPKGQYYGDGSDAAFTVDKNTCEKNSPLFVGLHEAIAKAKAMGNERKKFYKPTPYVEDVNFDEHPYESHDAMMRQFYKDSVRIRPYTYISKEDVLTGDLATIYEKNDKSLDDISRLFKNIAKRLPSRRDILANWQGDGQHPNSVALMRHDGPYDDRNWELDNVDEKSFLADLFIPVFRFEKVCSTYNFKASGQTAASETRVKATNDILR